MTKETTNRYIILTTIYEPTEATKRFSEMYGWKLIVVGDKKTPHNSYKDINCIYFHPDDQEKTYKEVSDAIGWNCIMRRNLGFLLAYELGADIVASVDDDNIPYVNWGTGVFVGEDLYSVPIYNSESICFDPLSLTNHPHLWHRGYPLEEVPTKNCVRYFGEQQRKILIQADLWDGDPDIDAVCRMIYNPTALKLNLDSAFTTDQLVPFNSQNTFLAREVLPYYMVLPHVGRMDDIWGGYLAEHLLNTRPLFNYATVYQDRQRQNIYKNLQDEVLGYTKTTELLYNISEYESILPEKTLEAFRVYRREYEKINSISK